MSPRISLALIGLSAHPRTNQGGLKDSIGGFPCPRKWGGVNPATKQVKGRESPKEKAGSGWKKAGCLEGATFAHSLLLPEAENCRQILSHTHELLAPPSQENLPPCPAPPRGGVGLDRASVCSAATELR